MTPDPEHVNTRGHARWELTILDIGTKSEVGVVSRVFSFGKVAGNRSRSGSVSRRILVMLDGG